LVAVTYPSHCTSPGLIRGLLHRAARVERSVGPGASPGEVGAMVGWGSVAVCGGGDRAMVVAHPRPGPPHKGEGGDGAMGWWVWLPPHPACGRPLPEGGEVKGVAFRRAGLVAVTYPNHCTSPDLIRGLLHRAARVERSVGPGASPGEVGGEGRDSGGW